MEKENSNLNADGNSVKADVSRSIIAHRCSGCGKKANEYNELYDLWICGKDTCKAEDIIESIAYHVMTGQ